MEIDGNDLRRTLYPLARSEPCILWNVQRFSSMTISIAGNARIDQKNDNHTLCETTVYGTIRNVDQSNREKNGTKIVAEKKRKKCSSAFFRGVHISKSESIVFYRTNTVFVRVRSDNILVQLDALTLVTG